MFFVNVQSYAIFCTLPKKTIVFFAFFTKEQIFRGKRPMITGGLRVKKSHVRFFHAEASQKSVI